MAEVKIKHVVSFDSEEGAHKADNLLVADTYRAWKGAAGARQHTVELQLEKATKITSLNIVNAGSAFVEVLVGRSAFKKDDEYQVLLCMSSFMSSKDCKEGVNMSRVRMFGADNLTKEVGAQKWDRVKIVCTQPFTSKEPFGIAAIHIKGKPEPESPSVDLTPSANKHTAFLYQGSVSATKEEPKKLGAFTLRPEKKKDGPTGSLFFNKLTGKGGADGDKETAQQREVKLVLDATKEEKGSKTELEDKARRLREHEERMKALKKQQEEEERQRLKAQEALKRKQPDAKNGSEEEGKGKNNAKSAGAVGGTKGRKDTSKPAQKRSASESPPAPPPKKEKKAKSLVPFEKAMEGVVFVLSGFQNPERGQIRQMALDMGARYEQDWGRSSTHLVAAFARTPKVQQVKGSGRGIVVTKDWIVDSYNRKRKLSEDDYLIDKPKSKPPPSDSESEPEDSPPPKKQKPQPPQVKSPTPKTATPPTPPKKEQTPGKRKLETESEKSVKNDASPPVKKRKTESENPPKMGKDGRRETEDEIDEYGGSTEEEDGYEKRQAKNGKSSIATPKENKDSQKLELKSRVVDPYDAETEEEDPGAEVDEEEEETPRKPPRKEHIRRQSDGDMDTEDELDKFDQDSEDAYDAETEEEDNIKSMPKPPTNETTEPRVQVPLPTFLSGVHVFVYGKMDQDLQKVTKRYVIAYGGVVDMYMGSETSHVVTEQTWDKNFDSALEDNPNLVFVRPSWVIACHNKLAKVPPHRYVIPPPEE